MMSIQPKLKNVQIVAKNGEAILRRPINSENEKAAIEGIAANIAGSQKLVSQIEVEAAG